MSIDNFNLITDNGQAIYCEKCNQFYCLYVIMITK